MHEGLPGCGERNGEPSARPRLAQWADRPATLIPECVVRLTRFVILGWRAASRTLRAAATHRVWRANAGRFKMTEACKLAVERRRSESNRRIEVLQTSALPLGYGAARRKIATYLDFLNPPPDVLPTSFKPLSCCTRRVKNGRDCWPSQTHSKHTPQARLEARVVLHLVVDPRG